MNIIISFIVLLVAAGAFSFLLLFLVLMMDSMVRGHDLSTSRRATRSIIKIISEHKTARNFYDLGCAHGALTVRIKRKFPTISVCAIDHDPIRIFFAKIRAGFFRRHIQFLRKNILDVDLSDADMVYAYLWYDLMPALEAKLQKELKPGALVVTNTSNFPHWSPVQKVITHPKISKTPNFETLFIYIKT